MKSCFVSSTILVSGDTLPLRPAGRPAGGLRARPSRPVPPNKGLQLTTAGRSESSSILASERGGMALTVSAACCN